MRARRGESALTRFFRNPKTGRLVIVQIPNLPLSIFLAASLARALIQPKGPLATIVSATATVSLLVWATLEITRGESPFRRALGAVVLLATVVGFATSA